MRAMVLRHPADMGEAPLQEEELPEPHAGTGEIRVRVRACGVCHTDLHIVEGELPLPRLPLVPGHQVVGIVDEVGAGVETFKLGDRAGLAWLHDTCGECRFCRTGRENLCTQARFTGYDFDGGFAEYVTGRADFAYHVPQEYSDAEAAPLLCAGIIGYRSFRLSGLGEKGRLGMYGFGASAHITLQVALRQGCEVYVFSRNPRHRDLARKLGAVWTGGSDEKPPVLLDGSILFAPVGHLVLPALEHLDRGGVLALAGIYMSDIPQMDYRRYLYYERSITSVANNTREDGESLMALAAQSRLETEVETFPLSRANEALLRLKESRIEASAVLLMDGNT